MGSIPTNRQPHVNAYVSRPDGQTWEAISSYLRSASIECGSIEQVGTQASGADGAIRRLTFTLQNDGTDRFSPQDQNSPWNQFGGVYSPLLWPGRQIEIQAAVTAVGVQPGTMLSLFRGYLGERFSTDGPTVDGSARDLVKRLQNKFIVTKRTYGSNTQIIPMEAVAQQILDDNFGIGVIALNCPVPTGRGVKEYELVDLSVWDALVQLTNPWGGWLGYRWNSVAGKWQLTLMQPPRDKGPENPDFTFDASDIYVEQLETSDEDIRNLVVVEYFNDATQQIESVTVQDDASVAEFGERAMKIRTERLHTEADARALAKAALHDMAGYPATVHLNLPFTPEMDLFAGILVTNPRISSTQDFYGVVSVRHDLVWGSDGRCQFRTDVIATGRVTGGHQRWLDMSTNPGAPGRPGYPDNQDNPATPNWDTCEFGRDITLRWYPVFDAVEYEVQRSGSAEVWRGNATTVTLTPISRSETFYLRAINAGHKYSGVAEITLTNSTPTTPPQPIIKEFFTALWIEIQPVADTDLQGYYLYTTPCDSQGTPTGPTQKTPLPAAQQVTYQASPGSSFLVEVSAFDVLGEGSKSAPVQATTAYINDPDIPDGMLAESKLQTALQTKINDASTRAEDYWNQEIGYPTEEDADITTTSYTLTYSAGDIYVGTEIEINPNAFFDLTDRTDSELVDANGDPVTILDVRDESGVTLLGAGKPEWYGGGATETVTLVLSAAPASSAARVHYAVRKNLRQLAKDALLKKGVTSKQIDANLVDAIENLKGAPWNETLSADAQIVTLATRVSSAEDTLSVHSTSIQNNADAIALKANQTDLDTLTGRVDTTETEVSVMGNQFAVRVQTHANGKDIISGFGLLNDPQSGSSEFGIMADKFRIFAAPDNPDEPGATIFALDTESGKLHLLADLILDGSITATKLSANTLKTLLLQAQLATVDEVDTLFLRAERIRVGSEGAPFPFKLIDPSIWRLGTQGAQTSGGFTFSPNGTDAENRIVLGLNPFGVQAPLWECVPDSASDSDGGWNTNNFPVDNAKTYRFSVWIRKEVSLHDGTTYFGTGNLVQTLAGSDNSNPYFWSGDLPSLDEWYLLVGYVHPSSYTGMTNYGGIYSKTTGEKVASITDFKQKEGVNELKHRVYLYYCTNVNARQYMWGPRVDIVDGTEPSIEALLSSGGGGEPNDFDQYPASAASGQITMGSTGIIMRPSGGSYDTSKYDFRALKFWDPVTGNPAIGLGDVADWATTYGSDMAYGLLMLLGEIRASEAVLRQSLTDLGTNSEKLGPGAVLEDRIAEGVVTISRLNEWLQVPDTGKVELLRESYATTWSKTDFFASGVEYEIWSGSLTKRDDSSGYLAERIALKFNMDVTFNQRSADNALQFLLYIDGVLKASIEFWQYANAATTTRRETIRLFGDVRAYGDGAISLVLKCKVIPSGGGYIDVNSINSIELYQNEQLPVRWGKPQYSVATGGGTSSGCYSNCEITCQVACEATCETTCQNSCQDACESSCQSTCETTSQGGGCLRDGTPVTIWYEAEQAYRDIPVEELKPGMILPRYDMATGKMVDGVLLELRDAKYSVKFFRIHTDHGPSIDVTGEQPFDVLATLRPDEGEKPFQLQARYLRPGMKMIRPFENREAVITKVELVKPGKLTHFWNPITDTGGYIVAGYADVNSKV